MQCSVHTPVSGRGRRGLRMVVPSYTDICSALCHGENPASLVTCPHKVRLMSEPLTGWSCSLQATPIRAWGYWAQMSQLCVPSWFLNVHVLWNPFDISPANAELPAIPVLMKSAKEWFMQEKSITPIYNWTLGSSVEGNYLKCKCVKFLKVLQTNSKVFIESKVAIEWDTICTCWVLLQFFRWYAFIVNW